MPVHKLRNLVCTLVFGLGCCLAAASSASAGGRIVGVADPYCDDGCPPSRCQQFCRTMKLHCVYFKRSCCQKYILVPSDQGCPAPGPYCPTYSNPFPYPTVDGYGTPPINTAPTGVFIR